MRLRSLITWPILHCADRPAPFSPNSLPVLPLARQIGHLLSLKWSGTHSVRPTTSYMYWTILGLFQSRHYSKRSIANVICFKHRLRLDNWNLLYCNTTLHTQHAYGTSAIPGLAAHASLASFLPAFRSCPFRCRPIYFGAPAPLKKGGWGKLGDADHSRQGFGNISSHITGVSKKLPVPLKQL